jgi:hypothetical protein
MPRGVYERTPEMCANMSKGSKDSHKLGHIKWLSDEELYRSRTQYWKDHPEAVDLASKKATEQHANMTKEEKIRRGSKIADSLRGRPHSEDEKETIRDSQDNYWTLEKRIDRAIRYTGEGNNRWLGTERTYGPDWPDVAFCIKGRDKWACQECKSKENLVVHHIDYDTDNWDEENLITLCTSCHGVTGGNRKIWKDKYSLLVKEIMAIESHRENTIGSPDKFELSAKEGDATCP